MHEERYFADLTNIIRLYAGYTVTLVSNSIVIGSAHENSDVWPNGLAQA